MRDIQRVLARVAAQERALRDARILAPCVSGGRVRVRVAGLVHTFRPLPEGLEGWAIFRVLGADAERVDEPGPAELARYLNLLRPLRLRLVNALRGQTWLAYPANESDARQRGWRAEPIFVHLVSGPGAFEQIVARHDGSAWWFQETDRRADPVLADRLRQSLAAATPPESLDLRDLTPELRTVYEIAAQQVAGFERLRDERRLRSALSLGGGQLHGVRDRGDCWWVEWSTSDGARHTSAIAKADLTVMSAGICLSGEDRQFDLQSLVGVVSRAGDEGW